MGLSIKVCLNCSSAVELLKFSYENRPAFLQLLTTGGNRKKTEIQRLDQLSARYRYRSSDWPEVQRVIYRHCQNTTMTRPILHGTPEVLLQKPKN